MSKKEVSIIEKETVEIIGTTQSESSAGRMLEELAVAGHFTAKKFIGSFVVYVRHLPDAIEEITINQASPRRFEIIKKTIPTSIEKVLGGEIADIDK